MVQHCPDMRPTAGEGYSWNASNGLESYQTALPYNRRRYKTRPSDTGLRSTSKTSSKSSKNSTMALVYLSMANSHVNGFFNSMLAHPFHNHNLSLRAEKRRPRRRIFEPSRTATKAFQKVDAEGRHDLDIHARWWWRSTGYALAVLLERARYSGHAQYQLLKFVQAITPSLGVAQEPGKEIVWKSFMTDDYNPVELSWDWCTGDKAPKIRFSIEPIGLEAGTIRDPNNEEGATKLLETMVRILPSTNMEWLGHFQRQLNGQEARGCVEGHPTREFYAFDLGETGVVSKAYFFPGFKARATQRSNFDIILDTIHTAPGATPEKLQALKMFQDYVCDPRTPPLEMDMLAIDLVDPAESRFKIYFRIRDTSFASVHHTMTLGSRIQKPELGRGLQDMRALYHALLGPGVGGEELGDAAPLPAKDHRTAGMLYNVEFKYGSKSPKVKAYLPVRHYAQSEEAVVSAVNAHLYSAKPASQAAHMVHYHEAIKTIFSREALSARSGLHTYIGCSVEAGGELRLVSYLNPRQSKMDRVQVPV
ncbi:aromatic prenyltransferase [Xylariaceae sp. FL0016]|nr:aromatic prenyltransferase [Xylariaceae sp. FL0016]